MPFLADPFAVLTSIGTRFLHGATFATAPATYAHRAVADDAEHVRPENRIHAMDTHRTDADAMTEHDPDGTPWAA